PFVLEVLAPQDLHRSQRSGDPARQPHLSVGASTDPAKHLVVRDNRVRPESRRRHSPPIGLAPFSIQPRPDAWRDRLGPCSRRGGPGPAWHPTGGSRSSRGSDTAWARPWPSPGPAP